MLNAKIVFILYLAAVIVFILAAAGDRAGRGGLARVNLVPLGLALWLFPTMWNTGAAAF